MENETELDEKKQKNRENKQIKIILSIMGVSFFVLIMGFILVNSVRHLSYNGVEFELIKEGKLIFYRTEFPIYSIMTGKQVADYNVYLRTDPRDLRKIPFEGELKRLSNLVINSSDEFNCDGDGVIATANLIKFLEVSGTKTIKDPTATCDSEGKYTFVQIQKANKTYIKQFGPSCYYINIKDCEIIPALERYMLDNLVDINK